jgi:hypothetical protein
MKRQLVVPIALLLASAAPVFAQTASTEAAALAEAFTKKRDGSKTRHGVTRSKYREVMAQPWVAASIREYAGRYESEEGQFLNISVADGGVVTGSGRDDQGAFELRSARISGAALKAIKAYTHGGSALLEAAFMDRSDRDSPDAAFLKLRGIGYLEEDVSNGQRRIFLVRK